MLHVGVLPHHDRWGDVLANLRYVVVDEAHVYRGVFGSHVGNVLRRLRRLARVYGADPQFLLASATIANPGELGALAARRRRDDGRRRRRAARGADGRALEPAAARRGARAARERARRGVAAAGGARRARPADDLLREEPRGGRARSTASPPSAWATTRALSPYRAGYTPAQRREIERRLVEGELLGVSATNALELGIDIGLLDCAISVGFPGHGRVAAPAVGPRRPPRATGSPCSSRARTRSTSTSCASRETLLGRRVEAAILDHANPRVLDGHVLAAAFEAPLDDADRDDARRRGARARGRSCPSSSATPAGFVWAGRDYPAARVAAALDDARLVHDRRRLDRHAARPRRARARVLDGPRGRDLPPPRRVVPRARARPRRRARRSSSRSRGDYYTQAKKETTTAIERHGARSGGSGSSSRFGDVAVTEQVVGFQKKAVRDGSTLETVPLDLPETTFATEAVWFLPEPEQLEGIDRMPALLGTLHAAEHSLIALLPLWAMCDRWDIGGLSTNVHFQTGRPTVFVYDGHAGGVGIAERGFDVFEGWVADTARLLDGCPCADGCPSCVQSPKCGNLNEMLDKRAALTLLQRLVAAA